MRKHFSGSAVPSRSEALLKKLRQSPRAVGAMLLFAAVIGAVVVFESTRWPAGVFLLTASGRLNGLDWADAAYVVRAGFDTESLVKTRSAYQAITNPYMSDADIAAGRRTGSLIPAPMTAGATAPCRRSTGPMSRN